MAAKRLTKRERRSDTVFVAEDPFRNVVRLERSTWEGHVALKHQEVQGRELEVKDLIESPDRIYMAEYDDTALFENLMLRAIVQYETEKFATSSTQDEIITGKVNTVYPNDPEGHPKVRGVIYVKRREGMK